jgi:hypothetical protein
MKNNFKLVFGFAVLGIIFLGNYNLTEAVTISGSTCTYKAEINTWSSCSIGSRYALAAGMVFATTTATSPTCVDVPTTQACSQDIDGNDFGIINIGTQTWMADNLKTTKYTDGAAITTNMAWYNNTESNKNIYGGLYNYAAVNTNKLCPTGWGVATLAEWTTLKDYLGSNIASTTDSTGGGTNNYGFSALGGGKYDRDSG